MASTKIEKSTVRDGRSGCALNLSSKSLLSDMSVNILCNFDVYS